MIILLFILGSIIGYIAGNLIGWKLYGGGKFNWRIFVSPKTYFDWLEKQ